MAEPGAADPLDAALDELYASEPSDFVACRTRLAAELRAAGHREAARDLRAARRPTTAAAAVNRAVRADPAATEAFLAAAVALQRAYAGAGTDVRSATASYRASLTALEESAVSTLARRSAAARQQIDAILHAAALDDDVRELLARGRLVREVTGPTGIADAPGLTLVGDGAAPRRPAPAATSEPAAGDERRRVAREQAAARRREELRVRLEQARSALDLAESGHAEAVERARVVERSLMDARRQVRDRARRVDLARERVEELRRRSEE